MSRRPGLSFQHETQRGHLAVTALLFKKTRKGTSRETKTLAHLERRGEKRGPYFCADISALSGCKCVTSCLFVCMSLEWMCFRRYLVAVGGMTAEQQRREQLDQALSAEDAALLEHKGVLEPAIPQPSSIRREAGAAVRIGVGLGGEK